MNQAIRDRDAFRQSPAYLIGQQLQRENEETTRRHVGRRSIYADSIREQLAKTGHVAKYDTRHIEAYMRLQHGTLDGLDARTFNHEVEVCRQCVDASGFDESEALAQSYGL